uniref:Uncharacterized protein n=1 Tax=Octopus bimaculoides TaxID=37653 RepID=A0A0L8IBJ6_OCTBM
MFESRRVRNVNCYDNNTLDYERLAVGSGMVEQDGMNRRRTPLKDRGRKSKTKKDKERKEYGLTDFSLLNNQMV